LSFAGNWAASQTGGSEAVPASTAHCAKASGTRAGSSSSRFKPIAKSHSACSKAAGSSGDRPESKPGATGVESRSDEGPGLAGFTDDQDRDREGRGSGAGSSGETAAGSEQQEIPS
jgi:hypothetical protein